MRAVDLHVHSNCSDGTYTPAELVKYANEKGLRAFALTDHDTIDGIAEAFAAAHAAADKASTDASDTASCNAVVQVIPGIEFSTEYHGRDVHIVGLYIPHEDASFVAALREFVDSRDVRNRKMCALLCEHGIPLDYETLISAYPNCVITRAHYADYLVKNGYCKSREEAFDKYLGDHASCYVPREKITPVQAVSLLKQYGAIAILAHPVLYHMSNAHLDQLVDELVSAGLDGLEAIYSTYSPSEEREMRALAAKHGLAISGGSDFHGANKPKIDLASGMGHLFVPEEVLDNLNTLRDSKWLIFSDLDGTLFNHEHTITDHTRKVLEKLLAAGHRFILSSGRPLSNMLRIKEQIGLNTPGLYLIAYNGAVIYDCDAEKIIYNRTVDYSLVRKIFALAKEWGIHCHTYQGDTVLSPEDDEELRFYLGPVPMQYQVIGDTDPVEHLAGEPYKVLTIDLTDHAYMCRFRDRAVELFGNEITVFFSNPRYLEFLHREASKGCAVEYLLSHTGTPRRNSIAFGDEQNDISMLEAAGIGVGMINGTDEVHAIADTISRFDCEHDGVADMIQQLLKI